MSQTLVISNDQKLVQLLELNLPMYLGTDVIVKPDYKVAEVLIENHPGIHLIICAEKTGTETNGELVFRLNERLRKKTPLIALGETGKLPNTDHVVILPDSTLKPLLQAAAKFLNVTPKKMIEQVVPDYIPFSITYCLNIKKAPCDIFLLKENNSHHCRWSLGALMKAAEVQALKDSGTEVVYVLAANRLKFVNNVTTGLLTRLTTTQLSEDEKVQAVDEALQSVQEEVLKSDTPPGESTQELTTVAINACLEIAQKNPSVAGLIKKLFANKSSFLYKHTQLIIHITKHILSNTEWGSAEQKNKLAFVAFFHDICLTSDKLAHYRSDISVSSDNQLNNMEKDLIIRHARMSAELVQKFPTAPMGADQIIMQHHGMISGQGFARNFTSNTSPLAIVFIIAEEFVHLILKYPEDTDLMSKKPEMLERLKSLYNRAKYIKIIETLETIDLG